ncbi:MAG: peptidase M6 [Pseudomonadota bacterium]
MWHNNKTVTRTYASKDSQNCHAILSGISGWKKVKTGSGDGVSNVFTALNAARAGGKRVDVFIVSDEIERVVMR